MFKDSSTKQSVIWGGLFVVFGVIGLLDSIIGLTLWVWVAAMALMGVAVLAIYFADTSEWWPLIPAYVLLALAAFIAGIELDFLGDSLVATVVLTLVAIPFLVVYFRDRSQWWPLIPSYILLLIALMVALIEVDILQDAWTATFVLGGIGFPFLFVFLRDRKNWWALIPAYVMFDIGFMVGLIDAAVLRDTLIPAYVMLSIALPFFVVYATNPSEWWPLIPGGIMGLIGVIFLMTGELFGYVVPVLIILAGVLILGRQFLSRGADRSEDEDVPQE